MSVNAGEAPNHLALNDEKAFKNKKKPQTPAASPATTYTQQISISEQKLNQRGGCFPAGAPAMSWHRHAMQQRQNMGFSTTLSGYQLHYLQEKTDCLVAGCSAALRGMGIYFLMSEINHNQEPEDYWEQTSKSSPQKAPWRSIRIASRTFWEPKQRPLPVPSPM